ncbi:MAG: dephospho-CoA kinase [Candidatus Mycalebacterium zealandia]|nr:MAG: dephospho-CoA kinase [Candidatus Mycalebacterium zealandia]
MAVVIGLCGNLCSGKSTVAGILSELGARVIDADEVSRFITEPGKPAFERVIREFGSGIVCADGKIDREKLGLAVFSDSEKRRALEAITHPEIRDEIAARTEKASADGAKAVVIEAALLARGGVLGEIIDHLILVNASEVKKIERVAKRDGFDETEAKKRLKSQQGRNPDFDFVIENDGDLKDLRARVEDLWERVVF